MPKQSLTFIDFVLVGVEGQLVRRSYALRQSFSLFSHTLWVGLVILQTETRLLPDVSQEGHLLCQDVGAVHRETDLVEKEFRQIERTILDILWKYQWKDEVHVQCDGLEMFSGWIKETTCIRRRTENPSTWDCI